MKQNWLLIGAIVATLAVPFGLAVFEDSTKEDEDSDRYRAAQVDLEDFELDDDDEDLDDPYQGADEPVIAKWERAGEVDLSFLDSNVSDAVPWLGGELALVLQSTEEGKQGLLDENVRAFNRQYDGQLITLTASVGHERHTHVAFSLPSTPRLLPALTRRWGEPTVARPFKRLWVWFSDDDKRRVVLEEFGSVSEISFSNYMLVHEVLAQTVLTQARAAEKVKHSALETHGELAAREEPDGFSLRLPPTREANIDQTQVWFRTDDNDRIEQISVALDFSLDLEVRDRLLESLASDLGKPKVSSAPNKGEPENVTVFDYGSGVIARQRLERLIIEKTLR